MTANSRLHTQSRPEQISGVLFILTLLFAPLAFGTTEEWSIATLELLVAVTGLLFLFPFSKRAATLYKTPGLLPLLLFLLWMYLQCIPLPPQIVRVVAPNIYLAYQPLLDIGQTGRWIPLTVNLKASLLETLRISSYTLFYILTVQLLSRSSHLTRTVNIVIGLALFIAFIAILQKLSSPHKIFWFREVPASAWRGALGPWVYPNQYAGFMVMLCPLVLALFYYYQPDVQRQQSIRQRFVDMLSHQKSHLHIFLAFGTLLVLSSIFLSLSRGGILSIFCALILFFIIHSRKQTGKFRITPLILLCFTTLAAAWFNLGPVLEKFLHTFSGPEGTIRGARLKVWQDSIKIVADFPITGSGFGSFADIYPGYKSFTDIYIYDHAHNDYIELLTDGGLIGFALAAWFVFIVVKTGIQQIRIRRDNFACQIATGALCGITGILLYSITDFNLHNGANGLYFFFLCGLLVSAGHTRHHYGVRPTLLTPVTSVTIRTTGLMTVSFLLAIILLVQGGAMKARQIYVRVESVSSAMQRPEKKIARLTDLLQQAIKYDPLDGQYPFALANIEKYSHQNKKALDNYINAAMKQPMEGAFLEAAGRSLSNSDPDKARQLIETGYRRRGKKENPD